MSIKKQEEEVKLLTETCKTLFTFFLTISGGLMLKAVNGLLLILGIVLDVALVCAILWLWFKIKNIIKTL